MARVRSIVPKTGNPANNIVAEAISGVDEDSSGAISEKAALPAVHPRNALNDLDGREWVKHTKSWFAADGKRGDFTQDIVAHPASFPPEVPERFINFFTKRGGVVLDPFVGCGSTLVAAHRNGRLGVGVELSRTFWSSTFKRISALDGEGPRPILINGDAREVSAMAIPPVDLVVTSPPYWDMLNHSRGNVKSAHKKRAGLGLPLNYGAGEKDIGEISDYDDYLDQVCSVFTGLKGRLKQGAHLVIVVQNVRGRDGVMRPVAWDIASRLARAFTMRQEEIWCQDQKRLGCWGYPYTYVSNLHHHYCLVFQNS